jgi:hypothetical protein
MPHASPEYKCRPRLLYLYADWDYQQDPDPCELCVDPSILFYYGRKMDRVMFRQYNHLRLAQSCGALLVLDSISEGRSTTRGSIFFLSVPLLK